MTGEYIDTPQNSVLIVNPNGASSVVLVCEHASNYIPASFDGLGMSMADRSSHAAWDPGAMALAREISMRLDATLVASGVSRLVYDCNRPPDAPDAMPTQSEVIEVPGNRDLTQAQRDARVAAFYRPFQSALAAAVAQIAQPIIVTIHSFTPIYHGRTRSVEVGILHDKDTRLASAMLNTAQAHTKANVQCNAPYGPDDGVTHTLAKHAIAAGHLNVMLEVRNDLLETDEQHQNMGEMIANWVVDACASLEVQGAVRCQA